MRKVENLSLNEKIYDIDYLRVKSYTYLCPHPRGGAHYSILIDQNEDPIRMYNPHLQAILDKNLQTYSEAQLALADTLEEKAKSLRELK